MVLIWKRLELLPQVEEFKWVKFKYLSITLFTRGKTGWEMDRCLQWHGCCNSKESWRKTKLLFYWASYIPILTYCVPLTSSVGWFFLLKESFFSSHCRQVLGDRGVLWFLRFSLNYCRVFTLQYIKGIFVMIWLYINNIELRSIGLSRWAYYKGCVHSAVHETLGVELLPLDIKRRQLRWLGHLTRTPSNWGVSGRKPRDRPVICWRECLCSLGKCLLELEEADWEASLPRLLLQCRYGVEYG